MTDSVVINLSNPSAYAALKISTQNRKKEEQPSDAAPVTRKFNDSLEDRKKLEALGSEAVTRFVHDALIGEREVTLPRWQADGCMSLPQWITREMAPVAAPPPAPRPVRVLDDWEAPQPFSAIAAHGSASLTLTVDKHFLIECAEEVVLQISNPSATNTVRLRLRDSKTGKFTNVGFISPAREYQNTGPVAAGQKYAAVLELMPT